MVLTHIVGNVSGCGSRQNQEGIDDHQPDPSHRYGDDHGNGNRKDGALPEYMNAPAFCKRWMDARKHHLVKGKNQSKRTLRRTKASRNN